MKSSTSGSVEFVRMSLDRPTGSIRLLRTDRTLQDRLVVRNVDLHIRQTKLINIKFV